MAFVATHRAKRGAQFRLSRRCRRTGPKPNPWHQKNGGIDQHVELYRQSTRAFAEGNQWLLIDIDAALREAGISQGWEKYFVPDGVHLNQSGNALIGQTVLESLLQSRIFDK